MQIRDFAGQASNPEPLDLPGGAAQLQNNVTTNIPGRLMPRLGISPVTYQNDQSADDGVRCIAAYNYQIPGDEFIIYLNSDGKLKQGQL